MLMAKILCIILCFMLFPLQVSAEYLKYAVVLPSSGSAKTDVELLHKFRLIMAKTALSFRGTPYVWGGNTPKGFDCSGFMKAIYKRMGVDIPRVSFDQGCAGAPVRRNLKSLRTGDLIYFKQQKKSGWPHHVGMYLWDGWFIHCASSKGVTVESLYTSDLRKSVHAITRIVFTKREGEVLRLANHYGLLTADSGVYDPRTGRVR